MKFLLEHLSDIFSFLCFLSIFIEKSSNIKIKPLTWLGNLINSDINNKIDSLQKRINDIEYQNAMKDLGDIRNRIIKAGMELQKGEQFDCDYIRSLQHDFDMYDYYKDTYKNMIVNGRKVKINGEVESTRKLINDMIIKCKKW